MATTSNELHRPRWPAVPLLLALPTTWAQQDGKSDLVDVWKIPTCGCCKDWVTHLESNGFRVRTHDDGNTDARSAWASGAGKFTVTDIQPAR